MTVAPLLSTSKDVIRLSAVQKVKIFSVSLCALETKWPSLRVSVLLLLSLRPSHFANFASSINKQLIFLTQSDTEETRRFTEIPTSRLFLGKFLCHWDTVARSRTAGRQLNPKDAALTGCTLDPNSALVGFDDGPDQK